ncbi:MAG TPA: hypothetical protein PK988_04390 [Candidatus Sumerlaeota bacterium]|nr:hypothetical protein [Candidatus Sumerlaeota bacterium]
MAARHSYLIYSDRRTLLRESQSSDGETLFHSEHGVPMIWIFAFGGRNIWNVGDDVEARGGAVGKRNPYETSVEVATTRLEHAQDIISASPYLHPYLAGISVLRRKLLVKPKTGFIRIAAPWIMGLKDQDVDRWRSATAFAENSVNLLSAGREPEAVAALAELKAFCPLIPRGLSSDLAELQKNGAYRDHDEAMRLAFLTLGEPDNRQSFEKAVHKDVMEGLSAFRAAPERKSIAMPAPKAVAAPAATADAAPSKPAGLLGKLTGLFGRK